jgi:hypothetical protein
MLEYGASRIDFAIAVNSSKPADDYECLGLLGQRTLPGKNVIQ